VQLGRIIGSPRANFSQIRSFFGLPIGLFIFPARDKDADMKNNPSKAYADADFLNSPDARPIRVQCELIEPDVRFRENQVENTIVIFGSARSRDSSEARKDLDQFLECVSPDPDQRSEKERAEILKKERTVKLSPYYDEAVELSEKLTAWSEKNEQPDDKYLICSGGGPGMMEAANRGASQANGKSVALGISLPFEQGVNSYATPELSFEFHYFFIRKFYFLYHAKAIVVFPGGFGTMDELFETLTLVQTKKLDKRLPVFLYGSDFWDGLINFEQFVEWGVISPNDLDLFKKVDGVDEAFRLITESLTA